MGQAGRASPRCRSTSTCRTLGTDTSASSSTDFIAPGVPRRQVPSTVSTTLASPSFRRETMGCGPKPENSGITTAPIFITAKKAMKVSGRLGMYRPTRSPRCMPRACKAPARRQTSASKSR
jgi:hypothetical protein